MTTRRRSTDVVVFLAPAPGGKLGNAPLEAPSVQPQQEGDVERPEQIEVVFEGAVEAIQCGDFDAIPCVSAQPVLTWCEFLEPGIRGCDDKLAAGVDE